MKGKLYNKIVALFCASCFCLFSYSSSTLHQEVFIGEREFDHYAGPNDPLISPASIEKPFVTLFADDVYKEHYSDEFVDKESVDLAAFWFNDFLTHRRCPNNYLNEHKDYIKYLFRLQAMSYLFEFMRIGSEVLYGFGDDWKYCQFSWQELFGQCDSTEFEMKKFLRRVKESNYFSPRRNKLVRFSKEKIDSIVNFLNNNDQKYFSLEGYLLSQLNPSNKNKKVDIRKKMMSSCLESKRLIRNICNGEDKLWGMSHSPIAAKLIIESNTVNVFNHNGVAVGCVERFVEIFSPVEERYPLLNKIINPVFRFVKNSSRHKQGVIFLPGALREFDDRGLDDFLFVKPAPVVTSRSAPTPIVENKIEVIPSEVIVLKKEPVIIKKKVVAREPVARLSPFESAIGKQKKTGKEKIAVDMELLKADFILSPNIMKMLKVSVAVFKTQKSLKQMKKKNKLGEKKAPLRLLFIRYLIETGDYHGLYNIESVVGNNFFLLNDLEEKTEPVLVELKFINNKWQIYIKKPPH